MAVVISKRILSDQDASFIKFGVMLTPKSSWGPRSDRFDDEALNPVEDGLDNKGFEEAFAKNEKEGNEAAAVK